MSENKIEIVDIDLGIDLEDEIKKKIESFNSDITVYTEELVKRAAKKQKKTNKNNQQKINRSEQANKAVEVLLQAYEINDKWLKGWEIARQIGLEPTPQNINKLSLSIRKNLEKTKKWTLTRKRSRGKVLYRLARFS